MRDTIEDHAFSKLLTVFAEMIHILGSILVDLFVRRAVSLNSWRLGLKKHQQISPRQQHLQAGKSALSC